MTPPTRRSILVLTLQSVIAAACGGSGATTITTAGMSQTEVSAGAEMLQAILNQHIVNMMEDAEMVMGMAGQSFTTAGGQALEVTVEGETVMVGEATGERYDIGASNGVIHVIDTVLIPSEAS